MLGRLLRGRDSSAILAAATRIARVHGLQDPVPLTLRFALHPRTSETDWQELMVRHLGLARWEIAQITSELEAVGPIAAPALRRHGLYWPPTPTRWRDSFRRPRGAPSSRGTGATRSSPPGGQATLPERVRQRAAEAKGLQVRSLYSPAASTEDPRVDPPYAEAALASSPGDARGPPSVRDKVSGSREKDGGTRRGICSGAGISS